jgi:hypothetical protein
MPCHALPCPDPATNPTQYQVLLLVSIVRATMESGRLEAPFPEVYRRWLAALQKMVRVRVCMGVYACVDRLIPRRMEWPPVPW